MFAMKRRDGLHGGGSVAALGAYFDLGAALQPQRQQGEHARGIDLLSGGAESDPDGRKALDKFCQLPGRPRVHARWEP